MANGQSLAADTLIFLRQFIRQILKLLAKIYLARVSPYIIVIAGTTNRHWIKEQISEAITAKGFKCRTNKKNFNAEIGLPLSVLGLAPDAGDESIFKRWFKTLAGGYKTALIGANIDYLVLEMAIDKPDDMDYLLSIIKPNIAVFTTITMIYPENFDNLDAVVSEYRKLIKALRRDGLAILNADDQRIYRLKDYAGCQVITYGIENKNADYLAEEIEKVFDGQRFNLHLPDMRVEAIKINRFGRHHIYAKIAQKVVNYELFKLFKNS